jgi:hypothetical protein
MASFDTRRAAGHLTRAFVSQIDEVFKHDTFYRRWAGITTPPRPEIVAPDVDIYTDDCVASSKRFADTLVLCAEHNGGNVPSVITEEGPLPIAAPRLVGERSRFGLTPERTERLQSFPRLRSFRGADVRDVPIPTVRGFFEERLFDFLNTRFGERTAPRPGCEFEVTTDTEGLTVFYSPVFILEDDTVFGEPTNPVREWLHPGNYYFGAEGNSVKRWFNTDKKYEVPRLHRAHLNV